MPKKRHRYPKGYEGRAALVDRVLSRPMRTTDVFKRDEHVRMPCTQGELRDLCEISRAWDVSLGNVVWVMVSMWLAQLRQREIPDLPWPPSTRYTLEKIGFDLPIEELDEDAMMEAMGGES